MASLIRHPFHASGRAPTGTIPDLRWLGALCGCSIARRALAARIDDGGLEIGWAYLFGVALAPLLAHVAVAALVATLPAPRARASLRTSWQMDWVDDGIRDADTRCTVRLTATAIVVAPARGSVAPAQQIPREGVEARGDGEAVRVFWRRGDSVREAMFVPLTRARTRELRTRCAAGIAAKLSDCDGLPAARVRG